MGLRVQVIVALLAAVVGTAALAAAAEAKEPRCNGLQSLCDRAFNEVVLPGTHNSMSAESLDWRRPSQPVAIPRQLKGGIRALLIDTHYGKPRNNRVVETRDNAISAEGDIGMYLCHVACEKGASKLSSVLHQIRRWVRGHPRNVLLIENEDYIRSADFVRAMRRSGLLDHVYRGRASAGWPPLRQMIRERKQVVMLADREATGDPVWYRPTFEGTLQETPNKFRSPEELIDQANWDASCAPNRGGELGSLFLMNHWSPPVAPRQPDLRASAAINESDVILGRALRCADLRGRLPSIIAVDQFTAGGLIAAVRDLNRSLG